MQSLRKAQLIARFVLVWFALSIGVAIASPMVHPQGMQVVCSASGSLKVIVGSEDGSTGSPQGHTLDCPLCVGLGAPPPRATALFTAAPPLAYALSPHDTGLPPTQTSATQPPARGPPTQA